MRHARNCSAIVVVIAVVGGCQAPEARYRLNSPPQGYSPYVHVIGDTATAMVANAARYDMKLTDYHFVSQAADLNGTGEMLLDLIGESMELYNKPLYYRSTDISESLYGLRVAAVTQFLEFELGIPAERIKIMDEYPSGRRIGADDAIALWERSKVGLAGGGTSVGGSSAGSIIGGP